MTLLTTATNNNFVLSFADRRSSVQAGNRFIPLKERFNKHVTFALRDSYGTATFTGIAKWRSASGKNVTTDQLIADTITHSARDNKGLGMTLQAIAIDLATERHRLAKLIQGAFPGFTIILTGFFNELAEPWVALITDKEGLPDWDEDSSQIDIPAPAPFQVRFAVRCRPTVFIGGYTPAASPHLQSQLTKIISADGCRAYDAARFVVSEFRAASQRSAAIGSRVSGIMLPAKGWPDSGLWHLGNEPTYAAMPRTVFSNGTQWEPSEVEFHLDDFILGELPRHGLLFESILDGRISRRSYRRLRRNRSPLKAPTFFKTLMYALFGHDSDDTD